MMSLYGEGDGWEKLFQANNLVVIKKDPQLGYVGYGSLRLVCCEVQDYLVPPPRA